jgi:transaldolase
MEFYLDTARLDEIQAAADWGVLRGVTTNPSHMAKAVVRDMRSHIQEICWLGDVPTSTEVVTTDDDEMVGQAREFATWSPQVVIKLPTIPAGLKAMKRVKHMVATAACTDCVHFTGCPIRKRFAEQDALTRTPEVNATLIFNANQAMLALAAGASYVSPFVGRLDAIGEDGIQVVKDIAEILRVQEQPGKIIAAALRHPVHVTSVAKAGAHIATMSYDVLAQLIHHPLTDEGLTSFMADYQRSQQQ